MARVDIRPELIRWARERSRLPGEALTKRFSKLAEWESGAAKPTLRQLEEFANVTATPFGYLFLPEPPEEALSIPDFRHWRTDRSADRAATSSIPYSKCSVVKPGCARSGSRRGLARSPLSAL